MCVFFKAALQLAERLGTRLASQLIIFASDFKRTAETANIIREKLNCATEVQLDVRLRERYFGEYEGTSTQNYNKVWENDEEGEKDTQVEKLSA